MKKILVLGSGRVAGPLVRYLLDRTRIGVTVASQEQDQANALVGGHAAGTSVLLSADDLPHLARLVEEHDLAVSVLPARYHHAVAELCIEHRTHMVTASYASPEMRLLENAARHADVMILCEMGLDPGIDHMSALHMVDKARERGGKILSFKSYCGGLPAPDANDNPFGYKFSWNPRGVLAAGKNSARWREDGTEIVVPGPRLFDRIRILDIPDLGRFEAYPNRDSVGYIERYRLDGVHTLHRGTLRYPGWCETWRIIIKLGLLDESPTTYAPDTTYARFTAGFLRNPPSGDLRRDLADQLRLDIASPVLDRLEWLGLFGDDQIPATGTPTTPLDVLAVRMEQKMRYESGQRDMIVLRHGLIAEFPDRQRRRITSIMVAYGEPGGDMAMARTVGLPAAIAARLIVTGRLHLPGVRIPVWPEIYNPVLEKLDALGVRCVEKTELA